ncbi:DNA polymerase III subunit beta [bacterium]|jgi:DNA polymerase III subunit beta|nr:DNA polymerase III subunit beta [bacterium]MBT4649194.1 DNA polymerase III subunit beta [bacterium]
MHLSCTQENLNKGLGLVSHIANKNSNLPILNNVLLKAGKNGLTLVTTDLEIGIKVFVRSKVEEEGSFTVAAKLLNEFIGLLPRENINIALKEDNLYIKSQNHKTNIKGLEAEDFPLIPEIEKENEVELSITEFKTALSQTVFAASLDGSRAEINAVNFCFSKDELIMAATDSYRLAEKRLSINNSQEKSLIIPLKTIQELLRILNDQAEQKLKLYFNENQIMFVFDGVELISRVVEGKYPDYQQIIPSDFSTTAKCETNKLIPAIKSAALFCKQGINDVRLSFAKNEIVIASASSAVGENVIKVPAEVTGDENDIVFNFRYLLDGLSNIGKQEVVFNINNNASPGLLQGKNNKNYLYLIMPIRQ